MPPREVYCDLCGGKFFAHSLPHHRKTCEVKIRVQLMDCPYCGMAVTQLELDSHVMTCKAAKAAGAMPTGQSTMLRQRLAQDRHGSAAATAAGRLIASGAATSSLGSSAADSKFRPQLGYGASYSSSVPSDAASAACLVPCRVCGRTFAMDRVAKHQAICQKVTSKRRPVFESEAQRVYTEGGSGGNVVAIGMPIRPVRGPAGPKPGTKGAAQGMMGRNSASAPPPTTKWREKSRAFREAMRSARQFAGGSSGSGPRGAMARQPIGPRGSNVAYSASNGPRAQAGTMRRMAPQQGSSSILNPRPIPGVGAGLQQSRAARAHAVQWEAAEAESRQLARLQDRNAEVKGNGKGQMVDKLQNPARKVAAAVPDRRGGAPQWGSGGISIGLSNATSADNPLAGGARGRR